MAQYTGKHAYYRRKTGLKTVAAVAIMILGISAAAICKIVFAGGMSSAAEKGKSGERNDSNKIPVPLIPAVMTRDESLSRIKQYICLSDDAEYIYVNAENFSDEELLGAANNPERLSFTARIHTEDCIQVNPEITEEELSANCPLFIQWDPRWGYECYGSGVLGMNGCAPTCMSMIITALTDASDATPDALACWSEQNGYYVDGCGTEWKYIAAQAEEYGLVAQELPLWKDSMLNALKNGELMVCAVGAGHFTTEGHFVVIIGFDEDGFIINDPNSFYRSTLRWKYDDIKDEIRNIWSISAK